MDTEDMIFLDMDMEAILDLDTRVDIALKVMDTIRVDIGRSVMYLEV